MNSYNARGVPNFKSFFA